MADDIHTQRPWLVEVAIEPKSKADREKLDIALAKLAAEDPSFRVSTDQESGQTILKGMGELHLDTKIDILRRTYMVDANVGAPQVAFRERSPSVSSRATPTRSISALKVSSRRTSSSSRTSGQGLRVQVEDRRRRACRRNTSPASKRVSKVCSSSGVVAGFPVVDVKVQLIDGKYHDVDSSAAGFEIASRAAFREALQKGKSVLLEPIMKVEVVTPEDYTGSVIGDLNSRRGQIQGQDMRGNANVINAMVPLIHMFGYVNNLRSMSQGRATFTMQFDHYAPASHLARRRSAISAAIGMRA